MENSKNNKFIILIFFLCIFLLLCILNLPVRLQQDCLWNFQSIYKMANYGAIYNVNNVIHTPIFFEIGNIFFRLFGSNFFVYSLLQLSLFFCDLILFYLIFRKLKISIFNSLLYTQIMFLLIFNYLKTDASYNILSIIFTLLGVIIYLGRYNSKKYHHLQGLIIFLTFFTKQTTGVYYAISIIVFEMIHNVIKKEFFINQLKKLCGFLPPLLISLLIMYFRGNLLNFINLCFGSLFEFGNSNLAYSLYDIIPFITYSLQIIVFSLLLICKSKEITEEQKKNTKFLICLSIFLSFNIFPLANKYHIMLGLTFYYVLFLYTLDFSVFSKILPEKLIKITIIIFFIFLSFRVLFSYLDYNKNLTKFPKDSIFYPAKISQESLDKLYTIQKYIEDKKENNINVIVISSDSAFYTLPLKVNNYEFDMLLSGNLGYNGIQNTINKISNMKNTEFLIFTDDDSCYWQEPKAIREYIISNFEKSGEILDYSIYFNK